MLAGTGAAAAQMPFDARPSRSDKEGSGAAPAPWALPQSGTELELLAIAALAAINEHRRTLGLRELRPHPAATQRARRLAQDMASRRVTFGHEGVGLRFESLRGSLEFRRAAELLARNRGHANPVAVALQDWRTSGTHRQALQGDYDAAGVGVARAPDGSYFFAVFLVRTASF